MARIIIFLFLTKIYKVNENELINIKKNCCYLDETFFLIFDTKSIANRIKSRRLLSPDFQSWWTMNQGGEIPPSFCRFRIDLSPFDFDKGRRNPLDLVVVCIYIYIYMWCRVVEGCGG